MKPKLDLPWALVAAVLAALYFTAMLLGTDGHLSLPLDDAFIFFQYAREAAAGHPFQYNGTDAPSGGVTSVSAMLLYTLGYLGGFRGDAMIPFAFLIGAIGLYLTLSGAHRLGRAAGLENPGWAPLFIALNGPLLWGLFAGMDLPLYVAALVLTLASWAEEARAGSGRTRTIVWGSLCAASRAEGLTFGVLLSVLLLIEARDAAPRRRFSGLIPLAAGVVPSLVLLAFTGHPSPTSLSVKGILGVPGQDIGSWLATATGYFAAAVRGIFLGLESADPGRLQANNGSGIPLYLAPLTLLLTLAGALPGAAAEAAKRRPGPFLLSLLMFAAGLAAAALVVPRTWHWHRYLIPLYAIVLPFAALGLERVLAALSRLAPEAPVTALKKAGLLAYVVLALPGSVYFLLAYAQNSADIHYQQKALALWTRDNLPPGETMAVNDAGALRYYGNRTILDLEGLISPQMTESRRNGSGSLYEALERMPDATRPNWLVVYPNWYDAAFLRPHRLVHQRRIHRQTIAGGNPMNVYQADWSLANSGNAVTAPAVLARVAGLQLADRLDVGDVEDEHRHAYRFRSVEGQYQGLLVIENSAAGAPEVMDGGRGITRDETFLLRGLTAGRDACLVLRSHSAFRVRIAVNGVDAGEWLETGKPGPNWTESVYVIPGSMITAPTAGITVSAAEPHVTAYSAFHYWIYQ